VTVDGETGIIVRPGDAGALAGAIGRLVGQPELRRRLGNAGHARAMAHYVDAVTGPRLRALFAGIEARLRARAARPADPR
jgi:glycosyltransferase involved in cell wall biosynthesis